MARAPLRWSWLAGLVWCAGCGTNRDTSRVPVSVFAASSLTDAFSALEAPFERAHPGLDVQLSFAGSQVLRLQIEQGAPAHVFASANLDHAEALTQAGLAGPVQTLGFNPLVIAVPPGNPSAIRSLEDLPSATRVVLGSETVPIGTYTAALFERASEHYGLEFGASVGAHVVSREPNVRLVRAKVELGEADAAVVYRSDTIGTTRVEAVPIPDAVTVRARCVVIPIQPGTDPADGPHRGARAFLTYLQSDPAKAILAAHGIEAR